MKKYIIVLVAAFFFILKSDFAQVKPFRLGFKLAPNLAWITPDSKDYKADGSVIGFSWGFISDFSLTENYFFETGFNVCYINGKLKYPDEQIISDDTVTGALKRKYNLRYLEIPLTLKMRTNKFGSFAFYGLIGLGSSFNIRAKAKDEFTYDTGSIEGSTDTDDDIKNDIKFMKESLIVGLGFEFFIDNSTSIIAGISFNNGFTNILKGENNVDPNIEQKAIPHYFEFNLGVIF
ncbi:MAG: PorT family protein [Bacteroidales bacterium]|nr:PorT family protein [Bacteroidales bacterium]